jgi:hypothetical protein
MKAAFLTLTALCLAPLSARADTSPHPDVMTVPADLESPAIIAGEPAPGKMVLQSLPAYAGTEVAHALYLPTDWKKGARFPLIIEYLGNGSRVRDRKNMGHALSGGKGFIWAVLPIVGTDGKRDMDWWWGDVGATVAYAKEAVPEICRQWGGDPARVVLTGYSRGAIACNYIGLHDDGIAGLWRAMIPVSHYDDGHTAWGMTPQERALAPDRLRRLGEIPQLICGEHSSRSARGGAAGLLERIEEKNLATFAAAKSGLGLEPLADLEGTREFVTRHLPQGRITLIDLPWVNHDCNVLHRDTPGRRQIRDWLQQVLLKPSPK